MGDIAPFYADIEEKVEEEIDNLKRSLKKYPVHDNDTSIEKVEPTAEEYKDVFQ